MEPSALKLTFPRVFRSELIKLRTLRSTWTMLGATLVVFIGFGALAAAASSGEVRGPRRAAGGGFAVDPVSTVLAGANMGLLVLVVFGVLAGAREYGSGMIRVTLSAVPGRLAVLWSKVLAMLVFTVPVVLVGIVGAFLLGMSVLRGAGAATVGLDDPDARRVLLGTAAYLVGLAIISLGLGMALRSIAGALATVIGGIIFLPALAGLLLPDSWSEALKYLPSQAASAFTQYTALPTTLGIGAGVAVFLAWVAVSLVLAAVLLRRRDA